MPRPESSSLRPHADQTWVPVVALTLGIAVAALLCFSWLSDEMLKKGTDQFDGAIRSFVHQHSWPWFTSLMEVVTNLGDWPVIMAATLGLLVVFMYRRDRDHIFLLLVTMAGGGILDGVLKLAFHRPRPDPFFGTKPTTYSFPSGHALISLCFYGLLAGMLNSQLRKRWQRALVCFAAAFLIGSIGLSRIYLGMHWPSDVLAGYAAAIIWMGAVRLLAVRIEARQARWAAR